MQKKEHEGTNFTEEKEEKDWLSWCRNALRKSKKGKRVSAIRICVIMIYRYELEKQFGGPEEVCKGLGISTNYKHMVRTLFQVIDILKDNGFELMHYKDKEG